MNPAKSTKLLMGRSSDDSLACKMKDGTYGSNNCQKCADGIIQTKANFKSLLVCQPLIGKRNRWL